MSFRASAEEESIQIFALEKWSTEASDNFLDTGHYLRGIFTIQASNQWKRIDGLKSGDGRLTLSGRPIVVTNLFGGLALIENIEIAELAPDAYPAFAQFVPHARILNPVLTRMFGAVSLSNSALPKYHVQFEGIAMTYEGSVAEARDRIRPVSTTIALHPEANVMFRSLASKTMLSLESNENQSWFFEHYQDLPDRISEDCNCVAALTISKEVTLYTVQNRNNQKLIDFNGAVDNHLHTLMHIESENVLYYIGRDLTILFAGEIGNSNDPCFLFWLPYFNFNGYRLITANPVNSYECTWGAH